MEKMNKCSRTYAKRCKGLGIKAQIKYKRYLESVVASIPKRTTGVDARNRRGTYICKCGERGFVVGPISHTRRPH